MNSSGNQNIFHTVVPMCNGCTMYGANSPDKWTIST